jgi:hypothetical protein
MQKLHLPPSPSREWRGNFTKRLSRLLYGPASATMLFFFPSPGLGGTRND